MGLEGQDIYPELLPKTSRPRLPRVDIARARTLRVFTAVEKTRLLPATTYPVTPELNSELQGTCFCTFHQPRASGGARSQLWEMLSAVGRGACPQGVYF